MDFPYLWPPLLDFDRGGGESPTHTHCETKRWGLCACNFALEWSYSLADILKCKSMDYPSVSSWIVRNHFKGTQTHWINLWINFSSVFLVLMPLKTTLERLQSQGKHVSIFSYLAPHVFVYKVAISYNWVIMRVPFDSVSPHDVKRCHGCREEINKVLWVIFGAVIC